MERPSRNRKTVNYSDFMDNDDEDFATVKAPPNKKARAEPPPEKTMKTPSNSQKETIALTGSGHKERVPLDDKLYKRDLETALTLSLLQSTESTEDSLTKEEMPKVLEDGPPVLTHCNVDDSCLGGKSSGHHPQDPPSPPVLTNCSVDVSCLGLDQITSELPPSSTASRQRKPSKATQHKKQRQQDCSGDEDFKPQSTPDSSSDLSEQTESEDEEYLVKKKVDKKKTSKTVKKTASKTSKKATPKTTKVKSTVSTTALSRSPAQPVPALKKSPSTPPTSKTVLSSSPAGGRTPKWNPPGLVGTSPCHSGPVKSPGMGLRLGLSRLARVKPLHPNAAAH